MSTTEPISIVRGYNEQWG